MADRSLGWRRWMVFGLYLPFSGEFERTCRSRLHSTTGPVFFKLSQSRNPGTNMAAAERGEHE